MDQADWILYGANGFTGKLIARRARERGLRPILAGRSQEAIQSLARELELPYRVFGLDDGQEASRGIAGARLVLHCAGPYSATSRPMVDACLARRADYLDITGELAVIDAVLSRNEEAKQAGSVLMPAVGFDVVPTDCMAMRLRSELTDASELELAFGGLFVPSRGTAKTMVEALQFGARARRNGALVTLRTPIVRKVPFEFGARVRLTISIAAGDLATAHYATKIPNITVYGAAPPILIRAAKLTSFATPIFKNHAVQRFLKNGAARRAKGPTEEERRSKHMWIWGRARNPSGHVVEGHLRVPEVYELTTLAALRCVERVLSGDLRAGATTPALAFGAQLVTELPGVQSFQIVR